MDSVPENSAETAMSYETWEERRVYKRYPTDLPVRFRWMNDTEEPYNKGVVKNVSLNGMFVQTENVGSTGTVLELLINVITPFGEVSEIVAEGKITWTGNKPGESGMGLCFTRIDRHAQYALLASAHHDYP